MSQQKQTLRVKIPYDYLREDCDVLFDFLVIKQCYSNGIIYDPRKHIIHSRLRSKGVNYTIPRIAKLIKIWLNLGWLTEDKSGALHFASNKNKQCVSVKIEDLKYQIRKLKVLNNLKQQKFARDTKVNLKNPRGNSAYKDFKRAKKNRKRLNGDTRRYDLDLKLSLETIAELIGLSKTTAFNTISRMIDESVISKGKAKYYRRSNSGYLKRVPNCYCILLS